MFLQRHSPDSGLRSELGNLVGKTLLNPWTFDPWTSLQASRYIQAAIEETETALLVRVELPGVAPDRIDVELVDDALTIGVKNEDQQQDGESHGHTLWSRRQTLRLPCAVDPDGVVARSEHGVLTVELQKPAETMPKRIPVTVT